MTTGVTCEHMTIGVTCEHMTTGVTCEDMTTGVTCDVFKSLWVSNRNLSKQFTDSKLFACFRGR